MAISDICELEVKELVEKAVLDGKSFQEAFAWLQRIYENSLHKPVSKDTIKTKYYRAKKVSNETADITPSPSDEIQENQVSDTPSHGGKREGAGRPSKYEQDTDALFNLKRWWRLARKKDRRAFLTWIEEDQNEVPVRH